jgi:dolichyl-phosphate-mannose-protein mannosyltransferase
MRWRWCWLAGHEPVATESVPVRTKFSRIGDDVGARSGSLAPSLFGEPRLIVAFVLIGLLARAVRYGLNFPLWDDESFLCVNFVSRSYAELLQPLDYYQVAPVLFLWIERTAVRLFGFSEFALRLFPFICSIASVLMFRRVAARLLSGTGLLLAVAIFAVSYPGIRYAAEAKPYGSDLFVSLAMLCLTVEWLQRRETCWLWRLTLLMPFAMGVSYPAAFAAGGFSLVVGARLCRQDGTWSEWRAWCAWNLTLVASFAFWLWLAGHNQNGAVAEFMGEFWRLHFPPLREPWKLPFWLLWTHASDFLAYPIGGPNWASSLTLMLVVAGLWRLWQRRLTEGNAADAVVGRIVNPSSLDPTLARDAPASLDGLTIRPTTLLGLCLAPAGLHFLAAALQRYPYGGHVKFSQYLAPQICCLAAVGIVQALEWWSRRGFSARRALAWDCVLLAAIGFGAIARDVALPYKTRSDFRARAFAHSFWFSAAHGEEVVCLKSDLGLDFSPAQHSELSWSAQYLCNRAIEVSRNRLPPPEWNRISSKRPLRCVLYRDSRFPFDEAALERWLTDMRQHYEILARESIPFPRFSKNERTLVAMEFIDSYTFVPRDSVPSSLPPPPLADRRANGSTQH